MPASERAASTFTLAGKARQASVAGPSKMSVSSRRASRSIFRSTTHGAPASPFGGLRDSIVTEVMRPIAAPFTPSRPAMAPDGTRIRAPFASARAIQSSRPSSAPQESTTRSRPAPSAFGAISCKCACVDASTTRSEARLGRDAIQYPLRYADAADREIVALLTACLAYGRVDLFGRALERALSVMGPSPAAFVREFDAARDAAVFAGFIYRFNRPRDLVAFCVAARDVLARHGTLEKCFLAGDAEPRGPIGPALERFARAFLDADLRAVFPHGRSSRGYRHLFPLPSVGGPCKRLLLFLRWMVRREAPDFGLWTGVSPSRLLIPVDTHVENMSRAVGLTRRRSRNWKMAEEI